MPLPAITMHAVFPLAVGAAQGVLEVGEAEVAEHLLDDVRDLLVLEDAAVIPRS